MKYKHDVEYLSEGCKPDLPDDTVVQWKPAHPQSNQWFASTIGDLSWGKSTVGTKVFKITAPRFESLASNFTKREELSARFMAAMLSNVSLPSLFISEVMTNENVAKRANEFADALLAEWAK